MPDVPEPFHVDRPFLYVIHDVEHGAPLFVGRVLDPRLRGSRRVRATQSSYAATSVVSMYEQPEKSNGQPLQSGT